MFVAECDCLIPDTAGSLCAAPGSAYLLRCDSGGVCASECEWHLPGGAVCRLGITDSLWQCSDPTVTWLGNNGQLSHLHSLTCVVRLCRYLRYPDICGDGPTCGTLDLRHPAL